jgi:hypothetical protein
MFRNQYSKNKVLRIDSSARQAGSVSRAIGAERLAADAEAAKQTALNALDQWLPESVDRVA